MIPAMESSSVGLVGVGLIGRAIADMLLAMLDPRVREFGRA